MKSKEIGFPRLSEGERAACESRQGLPAIRLGVIRLMRFSPRRLRIRCVRSSVLVASSEADLVGSLPRLRGRKRPFRRERLHDHTSFRYGRDLWLFVLFSSRRSAGICVDLDPMITYFGARFPAVPVKNDEVGFLFWHMAVNAVAHNCLFDLRMALGFMALQTTPGECRQIHLSCMNVVTSQTGHGR